MDKAVEVLKRELGFPDDRALIFVARFNTSKQQPFIDLSATEFNNFVAKISEMLVLLLMLNLLLMLKLLFGFNCCCWGLTIVVGV